MPISLYELYPGGTELEAETIADGHDVCVAVTLATGQREIIVAFSPFDDDTSRVYSINFEEDFPDGEELARQCVDDSNLQAVMLPGESHVVHLKEEYAGPKALEIRNLGRGALHSM